MSPRKKIWPDFGLPIEPQASVDALAIAWANRFGPRGAPICRDEPPDKPKAQSEPPRLSSYRPRAHSGLSFRGDLVVTRGLNWPTSEPLPLAALTLLALVDGESTVREIVNASGLEDDIAHDAIQDLLDRNMICCVER